MLMLSIVGNVIIIFTWLLLHMEAQDLQSGAVELVDPFGFVVCTMVALKIHSESLSGWAVKIVNGCDRPLDRRRNVLMVNLLSNEFMHPLCQCLHLRASVAICVLFTVWCSICFVLVTTSTGSVRPDATRPFFTSCAAGDLSVILKKLYSCLMVIWWKLVLIFYRIVHVDFLGFNGYVLGLIMELWWFNLWHAI